MSGKKTGIFTKVSHGSRDIDDHLIHLMSCQVKLEKKQFEDLVNCPLTLEGYLQELRTQGIILE